LVLKKTGRRAGSDENLHEVDYETLLGECSTEKKIASKINLFKQRYRVGSRGSNVSVCPSIFPVQIIKQRLAAFQAGSVNKEIGHLLL
jgi:hypothetical protein